MKINPDIFKAYDIRGKYPSEINEAVAERIGIATTRFIARASRKKEPHIVVCKDVRISSYPLVTSLTHGLFCTGANVIDAGISTEPYFHFLVHFLKADGGIMVTASHNPAEYNGFKIRGRGGIAIAGTSGLQQIKKLALQKNLPVVRIHGGIPRKIDNREKYIDFLSKDMAIGHIAMTIDAAGGSTVFFLPELLNRFPRIFYKPLFFTPDGSFQIHPPNPLLPESQKWVKNELKKGTYRCGVLFDGDGDRIVFFDESGNFVPMDFIFGILAAEELKRHKNCSFVMPANGSKGVEEYLKERGARVFRSRVGYTFVQNMMRRKNAVLGMEISGKIHFRKFFYGESGLLALLSVASILSRVRKPLSRLVGPFIRYVSSRELNFEVKHPRAVLKTLQRHFKDGKISLLDGITVEYPDWWFNARPSNTEPLVRLVLEARSRELFDKKFKEVERIIKKY